MHMIGFDGSYISSSVSLRKGSGFLKLNDYCSKHPRSIFSVFYDFLFILICNNAEIIYLIMYSKANIKDSQKYLFLLYLWQLVIVICEWMEWKVEEYILHSQKTKTWKLEFLELNFQTFLILNNFKFFRFWADLF